LTGAGLSAGIGVGTAYRIESQQPTFFRIRIRPDEVDQELTRLIKAIKQSRKQYLRDKKRFESAVGGRHSYIFDVHVLMLEDKKFLEDVRRRITEHLDSPERAVQYVADLLSKAYYTLDDPFFRERGSDLEEVVERIQSNLLELDPAQDRIPDEDLILAGSRIGLSVLARYPLERVKGLVLSRAGKTSHVAIIARSYRIPVVSGIENIRELIRTGDILRIDGSRGTVEIFEAGTELPEAVEAESRELPAYESGPCILRDQRQVYLYANTEFSSEVDIALRFGAEGIGLFRSEFLYMKHGSFVLDEEKHYSVYRDLARNLGDRVATIRTLDIAEEAGAGNRREAGEEGAVLGLRGIRFSLKKPEMFRAQVRAILRASQYGQLRIVLPMISSVDEILEARSIIEEVNTSLGNEAPCPVPVGALIEVPSAVLILDSIAEVSDFLAVGTNDLIQYILAVGRLNEEVSDLYNPLHPAVLKSLQKVVMAGMEYKRPVFVCGEMAAHPVFSAVLVGLGFQNLSMNAVAIPQIKKTLSCFEFSELRDLASRLITAYRLADIRNLVEEAFGKPGINGMSGMNGVEI